MTVRERFREVMAGGKAAAPKWEFGYWGANYANWYREGLPRHRPPRPLTRTTTSASSLYIPCWNALPKGELAAGMAVLGGGLYWPTQGFALDHDVQRACAMDPGQVLVNVDLLFHPRFEPRVIEETDTHMIYVDIDGVKRQFEKVTGVIPMALENPIRDWASWNALKRERLSTKDIAGRFPPHWKDLLRRYRDRDYPLVLGGYPCGYFGTLAHLMGYEHLFYNYADEPGLIHDINATFTEIWLAVYEEVLAQTDVDLFVIWEDISAGTGSMVAPPTIREFMLPYYQRLTGFLKAHGVKTIFVDTDGECTALIPFFLEAGVTGLYPMEASCGVDIVKVRKSFPTLQLMGGIPKSEIVKGAARIEQILEPVRQVLATGRYVPFGDHLIPPEVHWPEFSRYRRRLNELIDSVN
ncbi:MAG TPA: uroporphyrinogen decarboxylase family protein [Spirochaetia bacterium]|nr:uroporphyrinogen decarboxylase family protein [Spirochaetia bacterium]